MQDLNILLHRLPLLGVHIFELYSYDNNNLVKATQQQYFKMIFKVHVREKAQNHENSRGYYLVVCLLNPPMQLGRIRIQFECKPLTMWINPYVVVSQLTVFFPQGTLSFSFLIEKLSFY